MIRTDNNTNNKTHLYSHELTHNLFLCTNTNLEDNEH